jgi:ABC-type transporter Mla subunit MlaD
MSAETHRQEIRDLRDDVEREGTVLGVHAQDAAELGGFTQAHRDVIAGVVGTLIGASVELTEAGDGIRTVATTEARELSGKVTASANTTEGFVGRASTVFASTTNNEASEAMARIVEAADTVRTHAGPVGRITEELQGVADEAAQIRQDIDQLVGRLRALYAPLDASTATAREAAGGMTAAARDSNTAVVAMDAAIGDL